VFFLCLFAPVFVPRFGPAPGRGPWFCPFLWVSVFFFMGFPLLRLCRPLGVFRFRTFLRPVFLTSLGKRVLWPGRLLHLEVACGMVSLDRPFSSPVPLSSLGAKTPGLVPVSLPLSFFLDFFDTCLAWPWSGFQVFSLFFASPFSGHALDTTRRFLGHVSFGHCTKGPFPVFSFSSFPWSREPGPVFPLLFMGPSLSINRDFSWKGFFVLKLRRTGSPAPIPPSRRLPAVGFAVLDYHAALGQRRFFFPPLPAPLVFFFFSFPFEPDKPPQFLERRSRALQVHP